MMRNLFLLAVGALALTACGPGPTPEEQAVRRSTEAEQNAAQLVGAQIVNLGAAGNHVCIGRSDTNLNLGTELKGGYRRSLLTGPADQAGVRVYTSTATVTEYGSIVVNYATKEETCLLWTESLTLQEYAVRLGMSPTGLSPFYEEATTVASPEGGN